MIAEVRGVTFSYPAAPAPALNDAFAAVDEGAFTLVAGPSAGGKSTFLRLFNGLVPQFHGGRLAGEVRVAGMDPVHTAARRMATVAGMVFQEPEAQAITDVVEDEIAFGMEQHGVDPPEMRRRIDLLLGTLGIEHLRHRRLATLSGGERQRVAIAAVLALEPRLLLLDEPTSQLDPEGAASVVEALDVLHRTAGLTVLVAEHRLERLLPRVDGVFEVESGAVATLTPREAAGRLRAVPAVCELGRRLALDPIPLTVEEARPMLASVRPRVVTPRELPAPGDELLHVDSLSVAYGELMALREVSLSLRQGEVVALLGANGSGKSTLFRAISGLATPVAGNVMFRGAKPPASVQARTAFAGLVPQDPALALYRETVRDEVRETLRYRRVSPPGEPLAAWGVGELAGRNPRDVSVGQQQRIAVAAMLAHEPPVWLLDEPTRGADAAGKEWLAARVRSHAATGGAAIVATHDIESAARFATRVIGLSEGAIAFDLPAREAFSASGPRPTQVARLVPGALLPEEVAR